MHLSAPHSRLAYTSCLPPSVSLRARASRSCSSLPLLPTPFPPSGAGRAVRAGLGLPPLSSAAAGLPERLLHAVAGPARVYGLAALAGRPPGREPLFALLLAAGGVIGRGQACVLCVPAQAGAGEEDGPPRPPPAAAPLGRVHAGAVALACSAAGSSASLLAVAGCAGSMSSHVEVGKGQQTYEWVAKSAVLTPAFPPLLFTTPPSVSPLPPPLSATMARVHLHRFRFGG